MPPGRGLTRGRQRLQSRPVQLQSHLPSPPQGGTGDPIFGANRAGRGRESSGHTPGGDLGLLARQLTS
jgi:hypothetical protein